ncbi:LacI family DNA-binding transcriptional regulator [Agrobacterium tumefaciens]|uniref:LacI family transcriptional regulator n=1 Tax=Agrobacterium tumefaciens TaxID=358 RepID=A0A2L2LL15_AGRTU|nr:LacI family DNA-binding transcriptional regulator [Agrobacterium tumefaciens]AVH45040.1 LacI family transcriptional regulator [Agrobacterium tumefaciens]NSY98931.1 LacI family transcriptional regulator [Agrobacterium tumefaciens]
MAKVTALDIAKAANVSLSTVDRVLNSRGGVAEIKERSVLEWARKLKIDRALNQRAPRTMHIAVLVQPPDNPFHAAVQRKFLAAAREFPNYNLQFKVHHLDPLRPSGTARLIKALASSCDGMVIVSAQHEDIATALHDFGRSGKPVVTLATDIHGAERHAYVGPDNRKAGRVAGDMMGRLLGPTGGDIIVISGMLSMIGHEEREMGFRAVLQERYPNCRVIAVLESQERGERAGDLVFTALKTNSEIRGIYNASAGAQTVVDALRALDRYQDVVFITHELTEDRRKLLREGLIDQDPSLEVCTTVEVLAACFGRTAPPPLAHHADTYSHGGELLIVLFRAA